MRHETQAVETPEGNFSYVPLTSGTKLIHEHHKKKKMWQFPMDSAWILQEERLCGTSKIHSGPSALGQA